jgi:hypothetical protein
LAPVSWSCTENFCALAQLLSNTDSLPPIEMWRATWCEMQVGAHRVVS